MKLLTTEKLKGKGGYSTYTFSHRVKGNREIISVNASSEEDGIEKAWSQVKAKYKLLKQNGIKN